MRERREDIEGGGDGESAYVEAGDGACSLVFGELLLSKAPRVSVHLHEDGFLCP